MKINKRLLINVILLIILVKPFLVQSIDITDEIYDILKIFAVIYVIINYVVVNIKKHKKCSMFTILMIIYNLTMVISTILNSGNVIGCIGTTINTTALVMLTEIMLREDVDLMFRSYIRLLDIYLIINTISLILPVGVLSLDQPTPIFFLGIDNRFIFYYLPIIYFRFCYSYYKFNRLQKMDIFIYLLCLFTLIYRWCVGAMLGLLIYIPFLLFIVNSKFLEKICNLFTYFITALVSNYLIVVVGIQTYFQDFIENTLKKDITFSARTLVWQFTMEWIKQKPIIGNGYEYSEVIMKKNRGANHPHNYMLTILYRGGIILFSIFVCMIVLAAIKMRKFMDKKITKMIAFTIFASLMMSLMDSFDFALFFVMIQLGYHIEDILVKKGEQLNEKNFNIN